MSGGDALDRLLEATARAEDRHFWFRGLRAFARPLVESATRGVPDPEILDSGAGTGRNLEMLAEYGRAVGVERSAVGLAHARRRGRDVVPGDVARLPFGDARFDLVTSFDVLYCLPDPAEAAAVREIARVLRPGGHALVNVAAFESLRGPHSDLAREVRRYTPRGLRALLEGAGLEVVRLTCTHASLLPILLPARRLARRAGEGAEEAEIAVPPPWINEPLAMLLALEARVLRRIDLPAGSSVLALARKPAL